MCSASIQANGRGHIGHALENLRESGFYWGGISSQQAKELLNDSAVGSFLVRDSSDQRFLFTLSLKTFSGVTSVRIVMEKLMFRVDAVVQTPRFDCVLRLIQYYMEISRTYKDTLNNQGNASKNGGGLLLLYFPLYKRILPLRHLCRRTLNQVIGSENLHKLPVGRNLQIFLRKYPYTC